MKTHIFHKVRNDLKGHARSHKFLFLIYSFLKSNLIKSIHYEDANFTYSQI